MITRRQTFPYGTRRKAEILQVDSRYIICLDEMKDGHVLSGQNTSGFRAGDRGVIVYTKGCDLEHDYWKFVK